MVKYNYKRVLEERAALDQQWDNLMDEMNNGKVDREKLVWLMGRFNVIDIILGQQRHR